MSRKPATRPRTPNIGPARTEAIDRQAARTALDILAQPPEARAVILKAAVRPLNARGEVGAFVSALIIHLTDTATALDTMPAGSLAKYTARRRQAEDQ